MYRISHLLVLVVLFAFTATSCKKYADPPPYFEENTDTLLTASRRILFIGIAGAVGAEYKTIAPPTMVQLKANSKFSWEAVGDEGTTDAASWKTLVSGVNYTQHQIKDSTFTFTDDGHNEETHAPIKQYPSFFNYILGSAKSDLKTAFVSSWPTLLTRVVPEVETKVLAANDAAVKDSVVALLKNKNPEILMVDFNSVAIAGKQSGFSASSAGYKDAVLKVDGYIGEIINALKARPQFDKSEEWLVIINGTHGGVNNTYGGLTEAETNVPSFYWNPRFKSLEFTKEGGFVGVQFKGKNEVASRAFLGGNDIYNVGAAEQTIQLRIKGTAGAYPHFFSKMQAWPSTSGWSMFTSGAAWAISVRSTTSGEVRIQPGSPNVFDNRWHTLTVVFADSASKYWVRRYTDGVRHDQTDITTLKNSGGLITSPTPVLLGWGADPNPNFQAASFNAADVMIFNTALSNEEVASNICLKDVTKHPKYGNLIGYWPGNDGFGGRIKNKAPTAIGKDFLLSGPFSWNNVADIPCSINPLRVPVWDQC